LLYHPHTTVGVLPCSVNKPFNRLQPRQTDRDSEIKYVDMSELRSISII